VLSFYLNYSLLLAVLHDAAIGHEHQAWLDSPDLLGLQF